MNDKYTAEQIDACIVAYRAGDLNYCRSGIIDLLTNYAQMVREREVGGSVDPIGHPRAPDEQRDEIELFLRDAYAAGCHAAQTRSMTTAIVYAHREAPKLRAALESFASRHARHVPDGEVRLWDTQWMNIVNHDNCYQDWDKSDAINHAVKMTEKAIARNIADGKLPPAANNASHEVTE